MIGSVLPMIVLFAPICASLDEGGMAMPSSSESGD
jgi:hypothetical protein